MYPRPVEISKFERREARLELGLTPQRSYSFSFNTSLMPE